MTQFLGHQILAEFYGCDQEVLATVPKIEIIMRRAALASGATIVSSTFKQFDPWGVSGVVVIQESHMAIHTWPEHEYAAVDLFTCGGDINAEKGLELLQRELGASHLDTVEERRGMLSRIQMRQRSAS